MSAKQHAAAVELRSIPGCALPPGRALTAGEIPALLSCCAANPTPASARDTAVSTILVCGGLRRFEAVRLDLADYWDNWPLTVRGRKGSEDCTTSLASSAVRMVDDWRDVRGLKSGPLFLTQVL